VVVKLLDGVCLQLRSHSIRRHGGGFGKKKKKKKKRRFEVRKLLFSAAWQEGGENWNVCPVSYLRMQTLLNEAPPTVH
jgi:isopentenyldiphosphate isomerase